MSDSNRLPVRREWDSPAWTEEERMAREAERLLTGRVCATCRHGQPLFNPSRQHACRNPKTTLPGMTFRRDPEDSCSVWEPR